jgi:hypothetical protein
VRNFVVIIFLLCWLTGVFNTTAVAQQNKVIQFSGLTVGGDSLYGIPGVYLYVPKAGRGTSSNHLGYFSLPTLVGDTVLIKAIGYKQKQFIIPQVEEKLSVIIELVADTSFLPVVEIFPWPTEKIFKEAFLALELPDVERSNAEKNLNDKVIKRMLYNLPDDGSMNHRYFMTQQVQRQNGRFFYPTLSLLDPFAWSRFIKSVKNGELKRRDEKDYNKEDGEN